LEKHGNQDLVTGVTIPALASGQPVAICLRRSARARRFSLRVSRIDATVTLTLPEGAAERDAMAFLKREEAWLRRTLAGLEHRRGGMLAYGDTLPVEGVPHVIAPGTGRLVAQVSGRLLVPGGHAPGPAVAVFLRLRARERLTEATLRHAARLGRGFSRITLRDPRSRWGSCSGAGALMYSWRLIMAPPEVLDYVAAHEVAHLVEMNHGPAFWALVGDLCPGWRAGRIWLRGEGATLHRFRFGD